MTNRARKSSHHSTRIRPAAAPGESFHTRGVSAAAKGKHELAASLFAQAIQLSGPNAPYCHSLARSLHASGKYRQAAVCYQQAMAGEPDNINLHLGLAKALFQENRIGETVAVLKDALTRQPNVAEGWALLGNALSAGDRHELASEALHKAISLDPGQAGFHYDLGFVLSRTGESQEAEASYRRALELRARFPEALNNLGNLLRRRKATPQAVGCYQQALKFRPGYLDATYNLGLAFQDLDLLGDAAGCYETVLNEKPGHHASLNNLANILLRGGRVEEALTRYDEAIRLSPDNREYRVNLGMAQLLDGDFPSGWRNYGARHAPVRQDLPLWNGEPIEGRGILLMSEQGLGDTIQFIRYARRLQYEGGRVSALCPDSLAELLRTAPGLENVIVAGQQASQCDWYAPLMHLPRLFDTRMETIPADVPYLFADPERVRQWGLALDIPSSHLKVGLVWRGAAEHWNDRNRSIDPAELSALQGVPGIAWISLQKGFPHGHESLSFTPLPRDLEDFADTAALMAHLDLVISVDTSVAHLAGALARPVWTLLPFAPDWRWLRARSDSPWYPTMTLFRQQRRGEWKPVMERVREEVAKLHSLRR